MRPVPDPRLDKLADVLVGYSTDVRAGEKVLVQAPCVAQPLALAVVRRVVAAGGLPMLRLVADGDADDGIVLADGSDAQLEWLDPAWSSDLETADVRIVVVADALTHRALHGADPERQAQQERARMGVYSIQRRRAAAGELRWALTEYPTPEAAEDAGMTTQEYEDFVYRAGHLDVDDPGSRWREIGTEIDRVADFLESVDELRFVAEGTDLRVGVGGRSWLRSCGHRNFPDGETFTGPVEDSVDGEISFSYPGFYRGQEADGIRLAFERGEVVEATARAGQEYLRTMLSVDDGARRVGELAFGLNDAIERFTRNTLYDEKIGGTIHLALGSSYPETGGRNESALHWDIVCDMRAGGEVYADGALVYRDGRFLEGVLEAVR